MHVFNVGIAYTAVSLRIYVYIVFVNSQWALRATFSPLVLKIAITRQRHCTEIYKISLKLTNMIIFSSSSYYLEIKIYLFIFKIKFQFCLTNAQCKIRIMSVVAKLYLGPKEILFKNVSCESWSIWNRYVHDRRLWQICKLK